jgi:hypothetical protein
MLSCKKYWLSILCVGVCLYAHAQDTLTFNSIDKTTYQLYETKQWNKLQKWGNIAIKNGYDYYYLRMRLGIAAFESKQFREAIVHFKKALVLNNEDNLAYEYLYFAYLYCDREEAARKLSSGFNKEFADYMHTSKLNPINLISLEGGTKLSDSSKLFKPPAYIQVSFNHFVNRKFSLYHALTYYSQTEYRFSNYQFQYYLRGIVPLKKELTLTVGSHVLFGNPSYTEQAVVQFTVQDPPPYPGAPRPPARSTSSLQTLETVAQTVAFAGALTLTKSMRLLDVSLGSSVLLSDTATQFQVNSGITIYPLKNHNLIIGGNFYLHSSNYFSGTSIAYSPFITIRAAKRLYLNLSYFNNNGNNISEQTAFFINNSYDYTTQRWVFTPSYNISKKWSVYGTVGFEEKKEITGLFTYHYAIFLLGLKLNPFIN